MEIDPAFAQPRPKIRMEPVFQIDNITHIAPQKFWQTAPGSEFMQEVVRVIGLAPWNEYVESPSYTVTLTSKHFNEFPDAPAYAISISQNDEVHAQVIIEPITYTISVLKDLQCRLLHIVLGLEKAKDPHPRSHPYDGAILNTRDW